MIQHEDSITVEPEIEVPHNRSPTEIKADGPILSTAVAEEKHDQSLLGFFVLGQFHQSSIF